MRVGIYTNLNKDSGCKFTSKLVECLENKGISFVIDNCLARFFPGKESNVGDCFDVDILLTVGGDGTILRVAKNCAKRNVPILGFNCGHVGFLSEGEPSDLESIVDNILTCNYRTENRRMLECTIGEKTHYALNDFVVNRREGKLITVDIYSGKYFIDSHHCDGFIVSTPTGSTAYSLSAGGPIISPDADVIALTPINSHSLHSRPFVATGDEVIKICVSDEDDRAVLYADGDSVMNIDGNQDVCIRKSTYSVTFLRLPNYNFYEKLFSKLNTWGVVKNKKENTNDEN